MKRMRRTWTLGAVGMMGMMMLAGCMETHKEERNAAMNRWTGARAGIIYGLAMQQFEAGELDKARRTANQALSIQPDNPKFNVLAARIALENGELERAFRHLELAMAAEEPTAQPYYYTGVVMQRWQKYDAALAAYEQAFELEPDNVAPLLAAVEMLVKLDRTDEAVARLKGKAVYFEHNADLRLALGRVLMKQRKLDAAIEYLREAHLLAPDDAIALEQLALAEYTAHRYAEAAQHLRRLLGDPDQAGRRDLRMVLADCYQATGQAPRTRTILLALTREDPADVNAWVKLGQAAWMIGDVRRLGEAAERVTSLAPDRYEGHLLQGMAAREAGQFDQAMARFDRAASLAPDSALPHLMTGMTWQAQGEREAAAAAYNRAIDADPQDHRARALLASIEN